MEDIGLNKDEYKEKNMTKENAISRQVVKEQMIKYGFHAPDMTVTEFVEDLPPVTPQEPVLDKIRAEIRKKMKFDSFNEGIVSYDDISEIFDNYEENQNE